jgi:hypothetical protein
MLFQHGAVSLNFVLPLQESEHGVVLLIFLLLLPFSNGGQKTSLSLSGRLIASSPPQTAV